jgi:hypothetical protein
MANFIQKLSAQRHHATHCPRCPEAEEYWAQPQERVQEQARGLEQALRQLLAEADWPPVRVLRERLQGWALGQVASPARRGGHRSPALGAERGARGRLVIPSGFARCAIFRFAPSRIAARL